MRRFLFGLCCAVALVAAKPASAAVYVSAGISLGQPVETVTFRERLSPYGRWVSTSYGQAWVPGGVAVGWRPYSDGRWVLTEYGWTFVSDNPWGWATWHYGNWFMADNVGWVWLPGRTWSPAWVNWRYGGGYAAWAPMGPRGYVSYGYSSPAWVVVQQQNFTQPIARVSLGVSAGSVYVSRAQPLAGPVSAGNVWVNPGPRPQVIATAVGRPIQPVAASAVVGRGTASIASAPRAPAPPAAVAQATQQHWAHQAQVEKQTPQAARPAQPARPAPQANAARPAQPQRPAPQAKQAQRPAPQARKTAPHQQRAANKRQQRKAPGPQAHRAAGAHHPAK